MLTNKKILIIGVRNRRSIAHAVAMSCVAEGAQVAFAIQPVEKAFDKTAGFINADFPGSPILHCDVSKDADIEATVNGAAEKMSGLDGLLHGVAYANRETIAGDYHENITRDTFSEALDISVYSLTAFAKQALPHFKQRGGGSVVTLSYLGAERALPNYNVMGVAKAALEASVRYLAYGMGSDNVRVNAVSAGPIKTLAAAAIGDFGKILKQVESQAPLQRNITASEVGEVAAFLLSSKASAVSGEVLHVDAGFHITAGMQKN